MKLTIPAKLSYQIISEWCEENLGYIPVSETVVLDGETVEKRELMFSSDMDAIMFKLMFSEDMIMDTMANKRSLPLPLKPKMTYAQKIALLPPELAKIIKVYIKANGIDANQMCPF